MSKVSPDVGLAHVAVTVGWDGARLGSSVMVGVATSDSTGVNSGVAGAEAAGAVGMAVGDGVDDDPAAATAGVGDAPPPNGWATTTTSATAATAATAVMPPSSSGAEQPREGATGAGTTGAAVTDQAAGDPAGGTIGGSIAGLGTDSTAAPHAGATGEPGGVGARGGGRATGAAGAPIAARHTSQKRCPANVTGWPLGHVGSASVGPFTCVACLPRPRRASASSIVARVHRDRHGAHVYVYVQSSLPFESPALTDISSVSPENSSWAGKAQDVCADPEAC